MDEETRWWQVICRVALIVVVTGGYLYILIQNGEFTNRIAQLDTQVVEHKAAYAAAILQAAHLNDALSAATQNFESQRTEKSVLQAQRSRLEAKITKLKANQPKLVNERLASATALLKDLQAENAGLTEVVSNINAQIAKRDADKAAAIARTAKLSEDLASTAALLKKQEEENASLRERVSSLDTQIAAIEADAAAATIQTANLNENLASTARLLEERQAENAGLKQHISDLDKQIGARDANATATLTWSAKLNDDSASASKLHNGQQDHSVTPIGDNLSVPTAKPTAIKNAGADRHPTDAPIRTSKNLLPGLSLSRSAMLPASNRTYGDTYQEITESSQKFPLARVKPPVPEAQPKLTTTASPARADWLVQLGAHRSYETASSNWQRLVREHAALQGLGHMIMRADLGPLGTFYRLRVGYFQTIQAADQVCATIKSRSDNCLSIRHIKLQSASRITINSNDSQANVLVPLGLGLSADDRTIMFSK